MAAPLEWCKITILLFFKEKILLVFHQFFPVPECKSSDTIIISSRKLAYVHVSVFNSIVVCGRVWCFVWPMNVQSRLFFCGRQPQEGSVTQKLCWWCLLIEPAVPAVRLDEGARGSRSRYGKTHVCSMSWGTNTSADKGLSKLFEHGKNCTFRFFSNRLFFSQPSCLRMEVFLSIPVWIVWRLGQQLQLRSWVLNEKTLCSPSWLLSKLRLPPVPGSCRLCRCTSPRLRASPF